MKKLIMFALLTGFALNIDASFYFPTYPQDDQGYGYNPYGGSQGYYQEYQQQDYGYHGPDYGYHGPDLSDQSQFTHQQQNVHGLNQTQNLSNDSFASEQDKTIAKRIRDTISEGWFSKGVSNLSIDVNNGNVTLHGTVQNQDDKQKINEKVKKIEGVRSIDNQLIVTK